MALSSLPGAVVTVARGGEILHSQAFGFADLQRKERMTPQHNFRVASHSKMFAATALALLSERGELRFSDKASKFLPELKKGKDKRLGSITVHQLLSHTSGVVRDGYGSDFWAVETDFPDREQLLKEVTEHPLPAAPGAQMKYSNFGYGLLGSIVEAVSGKEYNEFVAREIVKPLGLRNTSADLSGRKGQKAVTGYISGFGSGICVPVKEIDTGALSAATGLCTTGSDLCHFLWAHADGNSSLLRAETRRELHLGRRSILGGAAHAEYGLGFMIERISGRKLIGHGGGFTGQISFSLMDPRDGLCVSVLTNTIERNAMPICKGIFQLLDFFARERKPEKAGSPSKRFSGRWSNVWSTLDFIPIGSGRVAMVSPTLGWDAFANSPAKLKVLNSNTLRFEEMGSLGWFGEEVHFREEKKKQTSSGGKRFVQIGSNHLQPHSQTLERLRRKKRLG